jgi:cell division protein FtsW (lipid II flippase)
VTTTRPARGAGFLPLFAALSLASVALGCFVAARHGAPLGVWARNLAAWGVGGVAALGLVRWAGTLTSIGFLLASPLALAAALFAAGQHGVHRWIDLGPVHMNVAEVLLPAAVVALGTLAATHWPWIAAAVMLGLPIAQPDASQATALGGALLAAVALSRMRGLWRGVAIVLVAIAVTAAWARPDPLAPVPDVEGIMALAWSLSPVVAILAWAALAGTVLTPMLLSRAEGRSVRTAAFALTVYAIASALTPLLGAFPVPLVGMGMSPILGLWLGAGLLAARARASRQAAPP